MSRVQTVLPSPSITYIKYISFSLFINLLKLFINSNCWMQLYNMIVVLTPYLVNSLVEGEYEMIRSIAT